MRRLLMLLFAFVAPLAFGAFPTVSDITEDTEATAVDNHVISMPATVDAGDLLLLIFCANTFNAFDTPSGWTLILAEPVYDGNGSGYVFGKDAVGNEDGTTVTINKTFGTDAGTHSAQTYRIAASSWAGTLGTDVDVGTTAHDAGASNIPDPPSVTAGGGSADNLFIPFTCTSNDDATVSGYPTNYTNGVDTVSGGGVDAGQTAASARRALAAASDNPGTFTLSEIEVWMANTLVVAPAASTPIVPILESLRRRRAQ